MQLSPEDTFLQKIYVAKIQIMQNVELGNNVAEYLNNILNEGQQVKNNQLLFSINIPFYPLKGLLWS